MPETRSRINYALLITAVIFLGLASRAKSVQPYLPDFISEYAGDTLWALTAFLGFRFLFPQLSTWRVATLAFGFAVCIELSQLYHAPWIDAVRRTRVGGMVLGFGFLWSDLACYAIGILCGISLEYFLSFVKTQKSA